MWPSALAVNRVNHAAVGDRAHSQARGGGAVHRGERPADADAENPPRAGDPRQFTDTGNAASRTVRHPVTNTAGIVWKITRREPGPGAVGGLSHRIFQGIAQRVTMRADCSRKEQPLRSCGRSARRRRSRFVQTWFVFVTTGCGAHVVSEGASSDGRTRRERPRPPVPGCGEVIRRSRTRHTPNAPIAGS